MVCPLFIFIYGLCIIDPAAAVLAPQNYTQDSSCGDNDTEHKWELADVQSGVGMLWVAPFLCSCILFPTSGFRIAVNSLLQSGYRPSRTLVLTLMLGEVRRFTYQVRGLVL
jgi:hypothetical protein